MGRIARSMRYEQEFYEAAFSGSSWIGGLVLRGAQVMLQKAVEMEVEGFLGREHYQHTVGEFMGHRNGYENRNLATGEGPIEIGVPQLRNLGKKEFQSVILEKWCKRSEGVEKLIPSLYVKGLSTRDTQAVLQEVLENEGCSRSTISKICQGLVEQFDAWKGRSLCGYQLLYLFLDGIYLPVRQGSTDKEGILVAYGITVEGKKVLLSLGLGERESYDAWLAFLHDLVQRGLGSPLLVILDGNPGCKKAVREVFPHALRQRCLAHKMRNLLAKIPRKMHPEFKGLLQRALFAENHTTARRLCLELIATWKNRYPNAMECLQKDLEECLSYLHFPPEHHKRIRTTNALERLFGEGKRRTKVIPRFPTEKATLSLLFSVLVDASRSWRGVKITPQILQQLDALRQQQVAKPKSVNQAA